MLWNGKHPNYDLGGNPGWPIGRTVLLLGTGALVGALSLSAYESINPDPFDASSVAVTAVRPPDYSKGELISEEVTGNMSIPEPVQKIDAITALKQRIANGAVVGYETPTGYVASDLECSAQDNRLNTDKITAFAFSCLIIYNPKPQG
ncbi:MAG: hypothetical protein JWP13_581 [Candidatus Saccharibacteria bacterium]|nr:hypothetical protein [Candidatus Saccharibacteria bacterium]